MELRTRGERGPLCFDRESAERGLPEVADHEHPGGYSVMLAPRSPRPKSDPPESAPPTERSPRASEPPVLPFRTFPAVPVAPVHLVPGVVLLGRYALDRLLSASSLSEVWAVRGVPFGKPLVVKLLRSPPRSGPRGTDPLRELRSLARLALPGLVGLVEVGTLEDGRPFVAMEHARGPTLEAELATRGRFAPSEAIALVGPLAEALARLHEEGILHGDLAPHAVILEVSARGVAPRLLDFALSRVARQAVQRSGKPGHRAGAVDYASPEQIRAAGALDRRSDVWALSALLFELLTGEPPFAGASFVETILAIVQNEPRFDVVPGPAGLREVLRKGLEKQPSQRFADLREFSTALAALPRD